jgi:hypothetical protein
MFGIVICANLQSAFLQVPGLSEPVTAPFAEIRNATPKTLDFAEVVEFALNRRNGGDLCASAILILTGTRERKALDAMVPSAPWAKPMHQEKDRPQHRGGQKRVK